MEEVIEEEPEKTNQVSGQVEESDNNDDNGNGDNGEDPRRSRTTGNRTN
jgi:hypothetical protein